MRTLNVAMSECATMQQSTANERSKGLQSFTGHLSRNAEDCSVLLGIQAPEVEIEQHCKASPEQVGKKQDAGEAADLPDRDQRHGDCAPKHHNLQKCPTRRAEPEENKRPERI